MSLYQKILVEQPTNVFAGADNKTLFITGPVTEANTLKMNVKGVEKF